MADQLAVTPELLGYVRDVSLRDDEILRDLREVTATLPAGRAMQVLAEEGQLLALLVGLGELVEQLTGIGPFSCYPRGSVTEANMVVGLTGARTVLEVGTFTGYSTLCMARALPPDGRVVTCDITDKWPMIAAEYWQRAGVADRIEVRIGNATETLGKIAAERWPGGVDLAFIDADKANYVGYYEAVLDLVKPGGLIVVDNTLFFGRVIDPDLQDPDTLAIRELNALLRDDDRVEIALLAMADGVTLVRKKPDPVI